MRLGRTSLMEVSPPIVLTSDVKYISSCSRRELDEHPTNTAAAEVPMTEPATAAAVAEVLMTESVCAAGGSAAVAADQASMYGSSEQL